MNRKLLDALVCGLLPSVAAMAASAIHAQSIPASPRVPRGIYATFQMEGDVNAAENAAYPSRSPAYPNPDADGILTQYFLTLLDDPAISGLAPQIAWDDLSLGNPGPDPDHPAKGSYLWNSLDDVFAAVNTWNHHHSDRPPKTIQIIIHPGFGSPDWVFSDIDAGVCATSMGKSCTGSCDGLFAGIPPKSVAENCGYTSIFFAVESMGPVQHTQRKLPLDWNSFFRNDWHVFLETLNLHIQHEPASDAFVAVTIAGPSASSSEMILPNIENQAPYTCDGKLSLDEKYDKQGNIVCPSANPGFSVPTAWNMLIQNLYHSSILNNTDIPFITEWGGEIEAFSGIFHGITLELVTTSDALPDFPVSDPSAYQYFTLYDPAPGFQAECGNDPFVNPSADLLNAMQCAAVTQVLLYFTSPTAGGDNAKLVFEAGVRANRDGIDLRENGIKWLSDHSAKGLPLPGTDLPVSRILGGLQFDQPFSVSTSIEFEGCPDYTPKYPDACGSLKPSEGLANLLAIDYFPGTSVGPSFCPYTTDSGTYTCAPTSVDFNHSIYSDAPMNFLEVYDSDIVYAQGLSQCKMDEITGNPLKGVKPSCTPDLTLDVKRAEQELELASEKLLSITESATP